MKTEKLWSEFHQQLSRFIQKRVHSAEDAEDILQTVFERVHRYNQSGAAVEDIENISAWLYRITRNQVIDFYRRRKDADEFSDELSESLESMQQNPEVDELDFIKNCMMVFQTDLKSEERELFMALEQGRSLRSIARDSNVNYSTLKSRMTRARTTFRRKFQSCCQILSLDDFQKISTQCKRC